MNIEILNLTKYSNDLFSEDILNQLKYKKLYVICKADENNNSNVEKYINGVLKQEGKGSGYNESIKKLIKLCNEKPEAALLYPNFNIGIYPNRHYTNSDEFKKEIYSYLYDLIILANEKYLRSNIIIMVLEDDLIKYSNELIEQLQAIRNEYEAEIKYLQKIYITPDCSSLD